MNRKTVIITSHFYWILCDQKFEIISFSNKSKSTLFNIHIQSYHLKLTIVSRKRLEGAGLLLAPSPWWLELVEEFIKLSRGLVDLFLVAFCSSRVRLSRDTRTAPSLDPIEGFDYFRVNK